MSDTRKAEENWIATSSILPKDGKVVWTMNNAGDVSRLKRSGKLWFVEDGSMYVYYVPAFWKPL